MKTKNFPVVILTTLFALLLWFSLNMRETYKLQLVAPLVIEGLPPGRAISSPIPHAVQLTFDEIGWKLAPLLRRSELKWVIDLSGLASRQQTLTVRDLAEQLGSKLGIQPTSMRPESFSITLDTIAFKRVIIVPDVAIAFREGYGSVGPLQVLPESVMVTGARSLVRVIDSWPTARVSLQEVRQPIDMVVPLADTLSQELSLVPDRVSLRQKVQQFAEKTYAAIPIELLSVPPNREVILSSPHMDVVVRGGIEQLAAMAQSNIRALLDYRVILADTSGIVEPNIELPSGIQIVRKSPPQIQYVVRKK